MMNVSHELAELVVDHTTWNAQKGLYEVIANIADGQDAARDGYRVDSYKDKLNTLKLIPASRRY